MPSGREVSCCAVALSFAGCVSTELDAVSTAPICMASSMDSGGSAAVVFIAAQLKTSIMRCSGVAIAPTLVVTVLGCVAEVSDPLESDPTEIVEPTAEPASDAEFARVKDYSAICDTDDGWALLEHGNFAGRLGDLVPPGALDVLWLAPGLDAADPDSYQTVKAAEVFTSRADSRCRDDIAVLRLEEPLAARPVTLRLGAGAAVGERVVVSNFCGTVAGLPAVWDTPSEVRAITRDASLPMLPPRSLQLSAELDVFAPGGAVLIEDDHSMLAMIVSGTRSGCETQTSEGTSFATHLEPFRPMLFDAAMAADEVLWLKPDANDASLGDAHDCSELRQ